MERNARIDIRMDGWCRRVHNQHPVEAIGSLLIAELVRMIPIGTCVQGNEAVDIGLAWFHRVLRDACHSISSVGNAYAMPVNGDSKGEMIDQRDDHLVSLPYMQCWSRSGAIEGPGRHGGVRGKGKLCRLSGVGERIHVGRGC